MENIEEKLLEDEDVDEKLGIYEDVVGGFVDPDYMDAEWE